MKEYDLQKLLKDNKFLNEKILELETKNLLFKQQIDKAEIEGHILNSQHNLRFIKEIINKEFLDWALVGCYYACYHAALALIQTKNYTSKNHLATFMHNY